MCQAWCSRQMGTSAKALGLQCAGLFQVSKGTGSMANSGGGGQKTWGVSSHSDGKPAGGAAKQQPCLEPVWETTEAQVLPAWRGWGEGQGPVGGAEPDDSPGAPGVGVGSM